MGMIQALSQCNLHRAVGILLKQSHMQQAECLCRSGGTVDVGRIMFEFSAGTDHLFFFLQLRAQNVCGFRCRVVIRGAADDKTHSSDHMEICESLIGSFFRSARRKNGLGIKLKALSD